MENIPSKTMEGSLSGTFLVSYLWAFDWWCSKTFLLYSKYCLRGNFFPSAAICEFYCFVTTFKTGNKMDSKNKRVIWIFICLEEWLMYSFKKNYKRKKSGWCLKCSKGVKLIVFLAPKYFCGGCIVSPASHARIDMTLLWW